MKDGDDSLKSPITATKSKLNTVQLEQCKKLLLLKKELDEAFRWLQAGDLDEKDLMSFCEDALEPLHHLHEETINLSELVNPTEDDFDIDKVVTSVSREGHDRMKKVMEIIRELAAKSEKGFALEEDIVREVDSRGLMSSEQARQALGTLKRNCSVYAKGGRGTYAPLAAKEDITTEPDDNLW